MFKSRQKTGLVLARKVNELLTQLGPDEETVVVALGRNAVPIALEVAYVTSSLLNVLVCKEIPAPHQPQLAIGAVTADGLSYMDGALTRRLKIPLDYIQSQKWFLASQANTDERTWRKLAGLDELFDCSKERVVLVDDGMESGMAALLAARSLRKLGAIELIFAAPIATRPACAILEKKFDCVVIPKIVTDINAVAEYYRGFGIVTREEVVWALKWALSQKMMNARDVGQTKVMP